MILRHKNFTVTYLKNNLLLYDTKKAKIIWILT